MKSSKQIGFTLIEMMVVLVVMAILVAIALPSYQQHFVRAARADAQGQMMDIALRQEQFLMADRAYVDKSGLEASGYRLPENVSAKYTYSIALGNETVPSFTITFTPYDSQAGDGDLTLSSDGVKAPADKW